MGVVVEQVPGAERWCMGQECDRGEHETKPCVVEGRADSLENRHVGGGRGSPGATSTTEWMSPSEARSLK